MQTASSLRGLVRHRVQSDRGMREGCAGAHLGGDPYRLHDLALARAVVERAERMAADAVRALRRVSDRHRDELLHLARQRTFGEGRLAELVERPVDLRGQLAP